MRSTRFAALLASLTLTSMLALPAMAQDASPAVDASAAPAAAEPAPFDAANKPYIPIVSKGFQHQFWQAVKLGAEQKGAELNAEVNFIGPATESEVAQQIEMLQAEFDKRPGRDLLRGA